MSYRIWSDLVATWITLKIVKHVGRSKNKSSSNRAAFFDSGCGVSEADMRAEDDYEYKEARQAAIEARTEAIKAKVCYHAAQAYIDAWRTVEASERAANRAQT